MERDIPSINRVDYIRETLQELEGSTLRVRANMGRSRIVERMGTIVQVHPALFVIEVNERRGRTSRQTYKYVDVLMGAVELYNAETEERLFDFCIEE